MTKRENFINWLVIGIRQEPDSLNEVFYYDKANNHFFSLLAMDFILLEQQVNHSYTAEDVAIIRDKVSKIKAKEESIIPIPRLSKADREPVAMQDVKAEKVAELFLDKHQIDVESCSFWFPQGAAE